MDSYVIRIYRRDDKDPGIAAGQVEFVEKGRVRSFTCADELVEILGLKKASPGSRSKKSPAAQGAKKSLRKKR